MANHNLPTVDSLYADYTSELNARLVDIAQGLDPAVATVTNPPTGAIRWSSASNHWQKWNGTTWVALSTGYNIPLAGPTTLTANSASAALTITQTGSGNALVVEDQAGDGTPFVIDGGGSVRIGTLQPIGLTSTTALEVNEGSARAFTLGRSSSNAFGAAINFAKSRSGTYGSREILALNDRLGELAWWGDDGAALVLGGLLRSEVDGTPATGSMPGRLVFSTTPSGSSKPAERMRIDSNGRISFGGAPFGDSHFFLTGSAVSTDTTSYGVRNNLTMPTGATAFMIGFGSTASSAASASAYTTNALIHYRAASFVPGTNHTVENQSGFAAANFSGATNNFGFRSELQDGVGRWNFYASGTAPNYFAGDVRSNTVVCESVVPSTTSASATLTASALRNHIVTGTPTAAITYTLPTGTSMDAAFTSLETNMAFEWSVINLAAATHTITLAANTDHTVVGNTVVQPNSSGRFATRKTAANTFITYRIA